MGEPTGDLTSARPVTPVDSCVLLDVVTEDEERGERSSTALAEARDRGRLVINPLVEAQVSVGFDRVEDLDDAVAPRDFERRSPPPDFSIGAHAAVRRHRLLTQDATRFRTCFPTVGLIAPPETAVER